MTSATRVPVIDLRDALTSKSAEARRETAAVIGQACRTSGFFAIVGHGVPADIVDRMYRSIQRIFALPDTQKEQVASDPADPLRRGLTRTAAVALSNDPGSRLAKPFTGARETAPDLCETFSICVAAERSVLGIDPIVGRPNRWPADPDIQRAWMAYATRLAGLASNLMRLFALALGLPERWFDDKIGNDISSLTANHYPAQPTPPRPGQLRKGEHTDWGTLTLLFQDGAPGGLQTLSPDGTWSDVPAVEGSFIVNIGDLMSRWTNDAWVSTAHRVMNPPAEYANKERFSIAYFHQPDFAAEISCIPTCLGAGEQPRYAPVTSGAYLLDKVARTHDVATMTV